MKRGIGGVFYGGTGVGKTSFCLEWARLGSLKLIECKETGFADLSMARDLPKGIVHHTATKWEELEALSKTCIENTMVIDGLAGVEALLFEYVCRTQYKGKWDGKEGFTSYWKGQRVDSPPHFNRLLDTLGTHLAAGKNVLLVSHVFTVTLPNTLGADYLSHVVSLDDGDKGGLRSCLKRWAPNIIFMSVSVDITRTTESEKGMVLEGKANTTDNRLMHTTLMPGHDAKNRLELPPIINMGSSPQEAFDNFIKALPEKVRNNL